MICPYCGQSNTKKDMFGYCKRYKCLNRAIEEKEYRELHKYDHLLKFKKREDTFENLMEDCLAILNRMQSSKI